MKRKNTKLVKSIQPVVDKKYTAFLKAAKDKILTTRIQIARAACHEQIKLYWWFGQQIVEKQELFGWGKSVIEQLAKDLTVSFPNSSYGFSSRNLWEMRLFYLEYRKYTNLQQLVAEIPWGQNLVILHKVKDINARKYYLHATYQMGWTRNTLVLQIDSQAYERQALAKKQNNFAKALPQHLAEQADKAIKDVYMLDILGLNQPILERNIELSMVNKIKDVMLELGYGFTFVGNQYRIVSPNGTENFIDLLFFNRPLKALIAMELKVGKFKPEYAGKMNYYLNLLDDLVKEEWENPSIGIILCNERDHIDVEYALRGINKPVGVSEFKLTRSLPKKLIGKLPDVETIKTEILKEIKKKIHEN